MTIQKNTFIALIALALSLAACSRTETPAAPQNKATPQIDATPSGTDLATRAGAPLFDGMGEHKHAITTNDPDAQRYFNQGLVIDFAFNHAESVRSFRAAQTLDPDCAMCYWGL
jgi:PBP1b-binding outer membrane lipoprotein LpoB